MLKLNDALTRDLLGQPETGMGYQDVEVTHKNDKKEKGVVYNAELLVERTEADGVLNLGAYSAALKAARAAGDEIKSIRVLETGDTRRFLSGSSARKSSEGPAIDAPVEQTAGEEEFKRFSAYPNDRRVTTDNRLLPGTFATTAADAKHVKTGADAVKRYALPNPAPASYVFTIWPKAGTDIQRGTAAPAYGQPGGGVEVIFTHGTTPHTVTGPVKIPDI